MSHEPDDMIAEAALGRRGEALDESVSLATPLTISRIAGRMDAGLIMRQIASAFDLGTPEFVTQAPERDVVTFAGQADGHPVGLFAVLTRGAAGTYNAVDLYARPWPFVAIARKKLAAEDDLFRDDVDLSTPYVAAGPNAPYLETAPSLPGLALDVAFHSPVLTATAAGRDLVAVILKAVEEAYGSPRYHWAFPAGDNRLIALYDGSVHGHVLQIAAVLTLNQAGQIADMRIYSRPWPVTALFRGEVYKLLRGTLGGEFWQGQPPLAALGEG
jgi:hypothetical protein